LIFISDIQLICRWQSRVDSVPCLIDANHISAGVADVVIAEIIAVAALDAFIEALACRVVFIADVVVDVRPFKNGAWFALCVFPEDAADVLVFVVYQAAVVVVSVVVGGFVAPDTRSWRWCAMTVQVVGVVVGGGQRAILRDLAQLGETNAKILELIAD
jgi:hypothetical protein